MKDIKDITNILKKISKRKKINTKKNLFAQGLDSLDVTTFLLAVEEKFKIKLKSDAYDKLTSIESLAKYLKKVKNKLIFMMYS